MCQELAHECEQSFLEDMNSLNIMPPSYIARVTEHMPEIVDFVQVFSSPLLSLCGW